MRVADRIRYDTFKANLAALKEKIDKNQNMVASQKKILVPSDDPGSMAKAIQLDTEKNLNAQYKKNLESLTTLDAFYDSTIQKVDDVLTRAKELAVAQASDNMSASTRATAAEEVKGLIEQLVALGNTKLGSNYIFAGKKSGASYSIGLETFTAPFRLDANYNVTYYGFAMNAIPDDYRAVPKVYVDRGTTENAGFSGADLFSSSGVDVFGVLKDLKDSLEANNVTGIRMAVDTVGRALNITEDNIAKVGTQAKRIELLNEEKTTKETTLSQTISTLTDADMVQLVSDYTTLSNAYQSLLYSMAKIQDLSVLNYLK